MAGSFARYFDRSIADLRGRLCTQAEIAEVFDVTPETIHQWQDLGMPYEKRAAIGESNRYYSARVALWLRDREWELRAGGESPKDRLSRVQAERIEHELTVLRGQVIPVEQIEPVLARAVVAIRAGVRNIPALAPLLEATPGVDEKRELLEERCHDILKDLADGRGFALSAPPGVSAVPAARAHDGGDVGGVAAHAVQHVGAAGAI
jgi:terminase small subunit / prophage DNA-packing protein